MEQLLYITADHREKKSGVIDCLETIAGMTVDVRTLPLGDYQVDNRLVFERKTLRDFQHSIIDGRLFQQLIRLSDSEMKGVLIIEGTLKEMEGIRMRREAMQGALITASVVLGIPVLRAMDPRETAQLIVYTARQIHQVDQSRTARAGYRPKRKRGRQLYILQGIPGIGRAKAQRLLDRFGSVEAVITATVQELQCVEGIGANIAEKIRWCVSEPESHFG